MKALPGKLRPASGFSHYFHIGLTALLPLLVYVLVSIDFSYIVPLAIILLSKWRTLAIRPRYWWTNIRYNAVDIMVNLSFLAFMVQAASSVSSTFWLLVWTILYEVWLVVLKPRSGVVMVSLQALIGQTFALMALFLTSAGREAPLAILVLIVGSICYLSARHFLGSFDERYAPLFAAVWGYFAASLTWILGHWLLFYGGLAQPALLLTVLGFGLSTMYYLDESDRLSPLLRRQFIFIMVAVIVVVLVFSDWSDKNIS